mmetsp:Transcript_59403/g.141591  ORF Transcript_59403/g.141591 Transcript_59403/m.141591 type:complete len:131 (+) Transcript_59403:145-537(+)
MARLQRATRSGLRLINRFSDCVPVLCKDAHQKHLLVVPGTTSASEFKTLFFQSMVAPMPTPRLKPVLVVEESRVTERETTADIEEFSSMSEVYARHKADDGFLHVAYTTERRRMRGSSVRQRSRRVLAMM